MWCRCGWKSDYLYEFDLCTSKKRVKTEHGLGEAIVLQPTESIRDLNCQVLMDNFSNISALQLMLFNKNVHSHRPLF